MFLFKHDEIIDRLRKYPIFDKFSFSSLKKLLAESDIIESAPGTILFEINDPSDCVYYVIDGYVDLFSSSSCDRKIASVRSGNLLGETSILAGEAHGFTARSSKFSQLIKMNKEVFLKNFEQDPHILMQLTQTVAKRLRRIVMGLATESYPFKHIVLYNTVTTLTLEKFKHHFQRDAMQDNVHIYDKNSFLSSGLDLLPFLAECDNRREISIFLLAHGEDAPWEKTVLSHAEYIYLITTENSWETLPIDTIDGGNMCPCDVVIWHEHEPPYRNTQRFYDRYAFKRHHHCRDEKSLYQRLYRYMTGQAIGLVISAGGFRGYAHYGLIKALLESKVPIDCIAGCSFGATIGAGLAENFDWEKFKVIYEKSVGQFKGRKKLSFNFTLPVTSLLSGKLPTEILQDVYADRHIEDMPINFFCITANLSTRQKEVKYFGKAWEWLRASIAVPGIFPPYEKQGNIYVDGAACTSLPIPDMREYLNGAGKIISFDVRSPLLLKDKHKYSFPPILSFKEVLAYKLGLSKKGYVLPGILDILLESSSIDQYFYDTEGLKNADIAIAADTSSLSFSDPSIGDPQSLIAYTFAKEKLKEHQDMFARWLE